MKEILMKKDLSVDPYSNYDFGPNFHARVCSPIWLIPIFVCSQDNFPARLNPFLFIYGFETSHNTPFLMQFIIHLS